MSGSGTWGRVGEAAGMLGLVLLGALAATGRPTYCTSTLRETERTVSCRPPKITDAAELVPVATCLVLTGVGLHGRRQAAAVNPTEAYTR